MASTQKPISSSQILIIFHLCFVFSIICWMVADPFFGEMYLYRKRALLYQQAMGSEELIARVAPKDQQTLHQNQTQFAALHPSQKMEIQTAYGALQDHMNRPFFTKISESLDLLFFSSPAILRAWITLSLILCFLLLFHVSFSKQALWIIPILATLFAFDNFSYAPTLPIEPDSALFPTENELIKSPLSPDIGKQQKELQSAWEHYLFERWGNEDGPYQFLLARLHALKERFPPSSLERYRAKQNPFFLLIFVGWNLVFAFCSPKSS